MYLHLSLLCACVPAMCGLRVCAYGGVCVCAHMYVSQRRMVSVLGSVQLWCPLLCEATLTSSLPHNAQSPPVPPYVLNTTPSPSLTHFITPKG